MKNRAEKLEQEYLKTLMALTKTTPHKKVKIGAMSLAAFIRMLVDQTDAMSLKTAKELYEIATELDELH
jgi:hypothetical protein